MQGHRHVIDLARTATAARSGLAAGVAGQSVEAATRHGAARPSAWHPRARIADGRRVVASAIEAVFGTRYTIDTLRRLLRQFPRVRFVWLMGADILEQLPRWRRWLEIVRRIPFAVLPRPGYNHRALAGRAARRLAHARRPARSAAVLAELAAPAWIFLRVPQHAASATAIRASEGAES